MNVHRSLEQGTKSEEAGLGRIPTRSCTAGGVRVLRQAQKRHRPHCSTSLPPHFPQAPNATLRVRPIFLPHPTGRNRIARCSRAGKFVACSQCSTLAIRSSRHPRPSPPPQPTVTTHCDMKLNKLKVRPKKDAAAAPCAAEFATMLACWASSNDLNNIGACKDSARSLQECMASRVSYRPLKTSRGLCRSWITLAKWVLMILSSRLMVLPPGFCRNREVECPSQPSTTTSQGCPSRSDLLPRTPIAHPASRRLSVTNLQLWFVDLPEIRHACPAWDFQITYPKGSSYS